jgi:hypothetical protein
MSHTSHVNRRNEFRHPRRDLALQVAVTTTANLRFFSTSPRGMFASQVAGQRAIERFG